MTLPRDFAYNPRDPIHIREDIREALDLWGAGERPHTGDFLHAVLSNNLCGAFTLADADNFGALGAIVTYCYNHLPVECWGSEEAYVAWATMHRNRLRQVREEASR